jgi:uncharacterized damage-inducible protein DinB
MLASTLTCLALLVVPQAAPSTALTQKDRDFAIEYLRETRQKFLASIDGLSDAQWTFKAGPDRWSIAETAEHIAVSESTILQLIAEKIMNAPAPPAGAERTPDRKVIDMITDRSQKAQAPEFLQPTTRYAGRDALVKDFSAAREKTIAFVSKPDADLRGHAAPHPVIKNLDAYQWVLLLAAHSARHTAQIEEVKTAAGYPKAF